MYILLLYACIGVAAGFLGGLFGIGGGLIVVPSLVVTFHLHHFPDTYAMHTAIGTSLAAMLFTSSSSAWAHCRQKGVLWDFARVLAPGVIVGAILGALFADYLSSRRLTLIFGISVIIIGSTFLLPVKQKAAEKECAPHFLIMSAFGILIGALSSLLGIGGGIITVPLLTALNVPLRNAIATSALLGFFIALFGALSFLLLGLQQQNAGGAIGFIYMPAFLCIGLTASLAAPYGAQVTYSWPTQILRPLFGLLLILTGFWMIH